MQDTAQAFHWSNAQATIHLFVFCHKSNNGDLCLKAVAHISDYMTYLTVAVYVFAEKLINDYVKLYLLQLQKIHYFSDRSYSQYKNDKNFANLIFHVQDFGITADWNFFATCHGKNLCDGVGGTGKCLPVRQVYKDHWITKS